MRRDVRKRTMTKRGRRQQIKARHWAMYADFWRRYNTMPEKVFARNESKRRFRDRILGTPTLRKQYDGR